MIFNPLCPYCGSSSDLVTGRKVYRHRRDLWDLKFWYCDRGHEAAFVGCHKDNPDNTPLGRLANAELRKAKSAAHKAFDPLWKDRQMTRSEAYQWLANELGLTKEEAHIGWFDEAMCAKVIEVSRQRRGL